MGVTEAGSTVDARMLEQLARLAGIEIGPERREAIAAQLDGLLTEADKVNRFMEPRRDAGIAVRFHHPAPDEDE
jgi:Asp-tRNA(Asn)/Glu-tRNA(Gln) amidotransferase C subunit